MSGSGELRISLLAIVMVNFGLFVLAVFYHHLAIPMSLQLFDSYLDSPGRRYTVYELPLQGYRILPVVPVLLGWNSIMCLFIGNREVSIVLAQDCAQDFHIRQDGG